MVSIDDSQKAALAPFVADIRASLDQNRLLDSLVERFAMQQLALSEMRREMATLRGTMRLRDVVLPELRLKHPGANVVKLDAAMPLRIEDGFHPLEYDGRGQPFRWTGPSPAFRFDIYVNRTQPMKFKLRLSRWKADISDRMRAYSDNIELPMRSDMRPTWFEYSGYLLPRETLGITRLVFVVGQMNEATRTNPDDKRILGVVFRDLEVTEAGEDEVADYLRGERSSENSSVAAAMVQETPRLAAAAVEESRA